MPHYGTLRDYQFSDAETADDIRGAKIYGRDDDKLGKIEDVIFDHSTGAISYVVVDSGGLFSSKKFLVPPHRLDRSADHQDDFAVNLSKEQIESLPAYKESDLQSEDKWRKYDTRYKSAWHSGPIPHREGSDHDVTPTPDEMPAEPGSIGERLTPSERAEVNSRIIPGGADEMTIQSSAAGIGGRWLTFEERLRQRRREITRACTTCAVGPVSSRSSESVDTERKAI